MKKILPLIILLIIFLQPQLVIASEYIVKPAILIPNNVKDQYSQEEIENRFIPNIQKALKEVQEWYAQKLNGKTFKFSEDVRVVYSPFNINLSGMNTMLQVAERLKVLSTITPQIGVTDLIFITGSKNLIPWGGWNIHLDDSGYAYLNNNNLNALDSEDTSQRNPALAILAHELGHSFHLEQSKHSFTHPCTSVSPSECTIDAKPPYPDSIEWTDSIMGYGSFLKFPDITGFNSSEINPEITALCEGHYLYPPGDKCPEPDDIIEPISPARTSISPNPVKAGEIVEIKGSGFGIDQGRIELENLSYSPPRLEKFQIIEWSDDTIKLEIDQEAEEETQTDWRVRILLNSNKSSVTYILTDQLSIAAKQIPKINLNLDIFVSCEDETIPFQGAKAILVAENNVTAAITNLQGKTKIAHTFDNPPQPGNQYPVFLEVLGVQIPSQYITITDPTTSLETNLHFKLPSCHPIRELSSDASLPPINDNLFGSAGIIIPQTNSRRLEEIKISNSPNFEDNPSEHGSPTFTFSPGNNQTIEWKLSTIYPSQIIYIRKIYKDLNDSSSPMIEELNLYLRDGQLGRVDSLKIKAKLIKQVDKVTMSNLSQPNGKILLYSDGIYYNPDIQLTNKENFFLVELSYNTGEISNSEIMLEKDEEEISPTPVKTCIYQVENSCFEGNCIDQSADCSFNINCGYIGGLSTGNNVECPNNTLVSDVKPQESIDSIQIIPQGQATGEFLYQNGAYLNPSLQLKSNLNFFNILTTYFPSNTTTVDTLAIETNQPEEQTIQLETGNPSDILAPIPIDNPNPPLTCSEEPLDLGEGCAQNFDSCTKQPNSPKYSIGGQDCEIGILAREDGIGGCCNPTSDNPEDGCKIDETTHETCTYTANGACHSGVSCQQEVQ